jgi:hypothetical protein
MEARLEAM